MAHKIWKILIVLYLFLLPWQTRWIFNPRFLSGGYWEYGTASFFATEIILWSAIMLFFYANFRRRPWRHIFGGVHYATHRRELYFAGGAIVFLLISVLQSVNRAVSYDYIFRIIEGACLITMLAAESDKKIFWYAFWGGAAGQGILAIVQFFSQDIGASKWLGLASQTPATLGSFVVESGSERWLRAYGSFGSPNILGAFLAVALVLGLILYLESRPLQKIYLTLGQSLILIGLILSFSRGAWAAAVVGIIGVAVYYAKRGLGYRFMILKQQIFYTLVVGTLAFILTPLFAVRFDTGYRLEARSMTERVSQNREAFAVFKKHPVFGVGPGVYTYYLSVVHPGLPSYSYQPVHNIYLLILVEWGLVGLIFWFGVFGYLAVLVHKKRPEFLPVILAILLAGVFDHFLWSLPAGAALWWGVFALFI